MRKPFRTLIVDDEPDARTVLRALVSRFCPQLLIIAEAASVEDALSAIQQCRPDLLFLNVELGAGNGFQVLDAFKKPDFKVVFTTGHQDFALDAFRYRAFHYLVKPIDPQDLIHLSRELEAPSLLPQTTHCLNSTSLLSIRKANCSCPPHKASS